MAEFTGERVVPGQVEPDLWNEHVARYVFASRLARGKRVLDIACGTGYGAAELATTARAVTGIDISPSAVAYAREHYPQIVFDQASATSVPYRDASFDLVTAFEVIEHLEDWRALLSEVRRLLAPGGQFIVSTPNRLYYEETRRQSGPNPFHAHEFDFAEFRSELAAVFPYVSFFLQNHSDVIVFQPESNTTATEVRTEAVSTDADEAHFFVAVCALAPQLGAPRFVYLPSVSNTLREREHHIAKLEQELETKSEWLEKALQDHNALVEIHAKLKAELEERNRWAEKLNRDLEETGARVSQLQDELAAEQSAARQVVAEYEAKVAQLESDVVSRTNWAMDTEKRLSAELAAKCQELAKCVEILHQTEKTLDDRTNWAQSLQTANYQLNKRVGMVAASRWYQLGRRLGLGPQLGEN